MHRSHPFSKIPSTFLLILLAATVGGGIGVFSKIALREIPPLTFTFLRFLSAGLVLFPVYVFRKESKELKISKLAGVILISLFAVVNVNFFVFGVSKTTASIAQMLYAAVPLIAGIFSYFLLKERIGPKKLLGILTGFVGVMIIILLPKLGNSNVFSGNIVGNLLVFIAVSSFALYSVISKRFQKTYSPMTLTAVFIFTTILTQLLVVPTEYRSNPDWWHGISFLSIFGLLYVGILGTGVYYLLYQHAIKRATPIVASMILYLQPIFTLIWAYFLLGEKVTFGFMMGSMMAFAGVWLVTNPKIK
jgi:drug/metabolite transporter (DMT)-like permease